MSENEIKRIRQSKDKLYEIQHDISSSEIHNIESNLENFLMFCNTDPNISCILTKIESTIKQEDSEWYDEHFTENGSVIMDKPIKTPLENEKTSLLVINFVKGIQNKDFRIFQVLRHTTLMRNVRTSSMLSDFYRAYFSKFFNCMQDKLGELVQKETDTIRKLKQQEIDKENSKLFVRVRAFLKNYSGYVFLFMTLLSGFVGYSFINRPIVDYSFITDDGLNDIIEFYPDGTYSLTISIDNRGGLDYPHNMIIELTNARFVGIAEEDFRTLTNEDRTLTRSFRCKSNMDEKIVRTFYIQPTVNTSKFIASLRLKQQWAGPVQYASTFIFSEVIEYDPTRLEFSRTSTGDYIRVD